MPTPEDWDQGTQMNMKEARLMNTGIYKGQVEHKYDYSAVQFEIPAFGWSSTEHHVGFWFVNPTIEYLSGGATKVELTGHLDNGDGADPTLLNYWRGSHYGGSSCVLSNGEQWTKVIGPFFDLLQFRRFARSIVEKDALAKKKMAAHEAEDFGHTLTGFPVLIIRIQTERQFNLVHWEQELVLADPLYPRSQNEQAFSSA